MKKVLIANRGECSLRIQKTLKRMGIRTVAVFSTADRESLHVSSAHEAYCIGEGPSAQSYLRQEALIELALKTGCDGIHPGYGFLAENAQFAKKVEESGLTWIGPKASLIELFGDKIQARRSMNKFNIPLLPGTIDPVEKIEEVIEVANDCGYPLLIKAAGGGGGKGMRVVSSENELESALQACQSEAQKAFSNPTVFVEKYLKDAYHIEFQVLGDKHKNAYDFGYRECSVQRRHQKVIEESPSLNVDPEEVRDLIQKLKEAISEMGYDSLGTFEFLKSPEGDYYFLEMNTRLQVEHSVTEMTHNVDLVELQVKAAYGEAIELDTSLHKENGWAVECRVYAEDSEAFFAPSPGPVRKLSWPQEDWLRVDNYLQEGASVPLEYDPMVAKLTVHGDSRNHALERMEEVLEASRIFGFRNNAGFHLWMIQNEEFLNGRVSTSYLDSKKEEVQKQMKQRTLKAAHVAVAAQIMSRKSGLSQRLKRFETYGVHYTLQGDLHQLDLKVVQDDYSQTLLLQELDFESRIDVLFQSHGGFQVLRNNEPIRGEVESFEGQLKYRILGESLELEVHEPGSLPLQYLSGASQVSEDSVVSPINGKIFKVLANAGDEVKESQVVVILEAMKMENEIKAPRDGVLEVLGLEVGETVEKGDLLFALESDNDS